MHIPKRWIATLAGLLMAAGLGAGFGAIPASAATVCAPLASSADHGYQSPIHGGVSLDAVGWGGGGSKAAACTGDAVNDAIVVWLTGQAGIAADFTAVPVGTTGNFQLVYTPGNEVNVPQPLCVSTVTDVQGAFARLRDCAGLTAVVNSGTGQASFVPATGGNGNTWQTFSSVNKGDGFFQLEAVNEGTPGPFFLNIKGFGGDGTQVISYASTGGAENQIWELVGAP